LCVCRRMLYSDGPFLAGLGAPIVIFGPGNDELAHKPDEYIEIADLEKAVEVYTKILKQFV
jgi:succinyl-diaminopimelate desuccinylase